MGQNETAAVASWFLQQALKLVFLTSIQKKFHVEHFYKDRMDLYLIISELINY